MLTPRGTLAIARTDEVFGNRSTADRHRTSLVARARYSCQCTFQIPEDVMIDKKTIAADERLRQEFNQWAEQGRGEEMENHHISIVQQTLARMELKPGDRVLDLGCGAGWASRLMASAVANGDKPGQVIGLDVSDEMIRRARAGSTAHDNLMFVVG